MRARHSAEFLPAVTTLSGFAGNGMQIEQENG
jgi:hypothetical protein